MVSQFSRDTLSPLSQFSRDTISLLSQFSRDTTSPLSQVSEDTPSLEIQFCGVALPWYYNVSDQFGHSKTQKNSSKKIHGQFFGFKEETSLLYMS